MTDDNDSERKKMLEEIDQMCSLLRLQALTVRENDLENDLEYIHLDAAENVCLNTGTIDTITWIRQVHRFLQRATDYLRSYISEHIND